MKEISYLHIIHTLISDSFGVVKYCGLRGEGKRDKEEGLRYGVKVYHMITFREKGLPTNIKYFITP